MIHIIHSLTCKTFSLLENSDITTFFPSGTLVKDTNNLPLTRLCTSSGKSYKIKNNFTIFKMRKKYALLYKDGCTGVLKYS